MIDEAVLACIIWAPVVDRVDASSIVTTALSMEFPPQPPRAFRHTRIVGKLYSVPVAYNVCIERKATNQNPPRHILSSALVKALPTIQQPLHPHHDVIIVVVEGGHGVTLSDGQYRFVLRRWEGRFAFLTELFISGLVKLGV